jgi:hypothetical protein
MTNSNFARVATVNNYPTGMMNTCQCGQVVLAPATIHDICKTDGTCLHSACGRDIWGNPITK